MRNPAALTPLRIVLILAAAAFMAPGAALAAGGKAHNKHEHWHFSGVFGAYDKDALQRGYQVYETVCSNCHALSQLSFRNLGQKGGPFYLEKCPEGVAESVDCSNPNENPIIKAAAANYKYQVTDGPDEYGDMFQRAALPSDRFPSPFANEAQARAANGGALPPDLSLIIKARPDGANYVYSLLTGYAPTPGVVNIGPAQHYNPWFPGDMTQFLKPDMMGEDGHPVEGVEVPLGGVLAMSAPLSDGVVDYADEATPDTVDQYAKDVVEFLAWASEPKMEQRKKLGVMALAYLLILTGLLYWSYREIWSKKH